MIEKFHPLRKELFDLYAVVFTGSDRSRLNPHIRRQLARSPHIPIVAI